jgi:carboxypeptidase PM20D1
LIGAGVLTAVLVVRAARLPSRQLVVENQSVDFVPTPEAVERLAGALRFPTVTPDDPAQRQAAIFAALETYLADTFPNTHKALTRETVGRDALLYTWPGTDSAAKPVVLMGHLDVVPVESSAGRPWRHPPFAGDIAEGFLWGRGALDDKATVVAILEATEALLVRGLRPVRTILLAFGADEESGGREGAAAIAGNVRSRYGAVDFVLDEGGAILPRGIIPGISAPVAVVGIAEKGFVTVELTADSEGGHSSTPPRHTTVGNVARAVSRLEDRPLPASLRGATAQLFDALAPEMPFGLRVLFANRWLFGPLLVRQLSRSPSTDAAIRTTTAATMFEGSPKDNVLASHARALVNFRIMPGETVDTVLDHVRRTVDDPNVHIRTVGTVTPPSTVSPTTTAHWRLVERTVRQTFPDVLVAPYLVLGATDSRYFTGLTQDVYRLLPVRLPPEGNALFHGPNERISTSAYLDAVRFYATLIERAAAQ